MRPPAPFPWAKPRRERLLLALVVVAALTPVYVVSTQDVSHFCLTRALAAGKFAIAPCGKYSVDIASYGGHIYSNKAPGMSALALPAVEAVGLPSALRWPAGGDLQLWLVRALTSGVAFLACAFLVGRVAEGLVAGSGGAVLVTFGLGTFVTPFAASGFDHVPTAALSFAAFVLAWSRRPSLAGVAAGLAYAVEYEAAAVLLLVAVYVALHGRGPFGRYVAGAAPAVLLSAAYSWLAFGAPWRIPQHYDVYSFPDVKPGGILGVHAPTFKSIRLVFVGDRGLLVATPVVLAAAIGLGLLWRRGFRAESLLCAAVTAVFVVGECGYGDPYGGLSAGPRYLIPALPFLALGLAPAFKRWRIPTALLSAASIVATIALTLTWARSAGKHYRETVWGEIGRTTWHPSGSRLIGELAKNVVDSAGVSRLSAAGMVCACAVFAYALALRQR